MIIKKEFIQIRPKGYQPRYKKEFKMAQFIEPATPPELQYDFYDKNKNFNSKEILREYELLMKAKKAYKRKGYDRFLLLQEKLK